MLFLQTYWLCDLIWNSSLQCEELKVSKTRVPLFFYVFQYVLQKQRKGQKKSSKANSKDKPRFRKA